jgi:hypothetical protein
MDMGGEEEYGLGMGGLGEQNETHQLPHQGS